MPLIFYISGHGFGHASRDVEIINAIGDRLDAPIVIRTSVSPDLLKRTLRVPVDLRPGICDTGIVQATSVSHDDPATVAAAAAFYGDFPRRVDEEVARLADVDVELIVGDIPPLAFATATALGVPSVAIGNFTWDWIYETQPGLLPDGAAIIDLIRTCYRGVDLAIELPFSGGFEVFSRVTRVPLVARRSTQPADATREFFGLPGRGRVALLSFGGYGLPSLDLAGIDCRDDWTIVTTDRVTTGTAAPPHVRRIVEREFLESAFRYEDLVAASDVVMTKPGYGIIGECISTGTGLVYTPRGPFREYDVLVDALPRLVRSAFISHDDLFAGRWRAALEATLAQPAPPERMEPTGAEVAADLVLHALDESRNRV